MDGAQLELCVLSFSGDTKVEIKLPSSATVLDAKRALASDMHVSHYQLRLIFDGSTPPDSSPLQLQPHPLTATVVKLPYQDDAALIDGFCNAASRGDCTEVEAMLQVPLDPDPKPESCTNGLPLLHAAIGGNVDAVRLLCEAGASTNKGEETPLAATVRRLTDFHTINRRRAVVQVLCEFKADVNQMITDLGQTPLDFVAKNVHDPHIMKVLCEARADLHALHQNQTPLLFALRHTNDDVAAVLRAAGATPLPIRHVVDLLAVRLGYISCIFLLGLIVTIALWSDATAEAVCGLIPGAGAMCLITDFLNFGERMSNGRLICIFISCFLFMPMITSITVALELAAAVDLVCYWRKLSGISIWLTLPEAIVAAVPILGAICTCICGMYQVVTLFRPSDIAVIPYARWKGVFGIFFIPECLYLGCHISPMVKLWIAPWGNVLNVLIHVIGLIIMTRGLCLYSRHVKLLPHVSSSLVACCCAPFTKASEPHSASEPLLGP